jgi:transmembrane sensor
MNIRNYRELCIKAVTENINKVEEQILNSWLAESEHNKNEYEEIKNIWANSAPPKVAQIPDIDAEWIALNIRIENTRKEKTEKDSILSKIFTNTQPIFINKWKPVSGFAVGLIFLAVGIFYFNHQPPTPQILTSSTANNEHRLIQLAEGSTVLLNGNSTLKYNQTFEGDVREVSLSGEAFFSITKDTRPFIVTTSNAKTTVLGTKFDVWSRNEKTRVFVKEGRVNLASKDENNSGVILSRNQLSVIKNNFKPTIPESVESSFLLGWIENKLIFDHTPLNEILDELERYYNVKFSLSNENLKTNTLTGSFKCKDVDSVLTMICLALDLSYDKQNDGYVIKTKLINNR